MLLFILAYGGGIFTIISPCILPVLPFVFSRAGQPFQRSGLPMLAGMAMSFAMVASLAAVVGNWVIEVNQYGRWAAMGLLSLFGASLLFPQLAVWLARPAVALGSRLSNAHLPNSHEFGQVVASTRRQHASALGSIVGSGFLGVATGLLWTPCAGPILGLILTGAALNGANFHTGLLLFAYAAGAATSLACALLIGGKIGNFMKKTLKWGGELKRACGALILACVGFIVLGFDSGFLAPLSLANTTAIEQKLIDELNAGIRDIKSPPAMMAANPAVMMSASPAMMAASPAMVGVDDTLTLQLTAPEFDGATDWLNSLPLTLASLKGKVVLVDFWTYSCINCLRAIPYVRAWAEKYKEQGLIVIGVHTPEFAFERNLDNVRRAVTSQQINYPVALDNAYAIWRAYGNQYWPAHYFIDAEGRIRHQHFGEGDYERSERIIQQLLAQAGQTETKSGLVHPVTTGAEIAPDLDNILSPETYIGFSRAKNFVSPGGIVQNKATDYVVSDLRLNEWSLAGQWYIGEEAARLESEQGSIIFRFHARDLHMVLGSGTDGTQVRFRILLDGKPPPLTVRGTDVNEQGEGIINGQRLYQLIRQEAGTIETHDFTIEFLDKGVEAYAFTFG